MKNILLLLAVAVAAVFVVEISCHGDFNGWKHGGGRRKGPRPFFGPFDENKCNKSVFNLSTSDTNKVVIVVLFRNDTIISRSFDRNLSAAGYRASETTTNYTAEISLIKIFPPQKGNIACYFTPTNKNYDTESANIIKYNNTDVSIVPLTKAYDGTGDAKTKEETESILANFRSYNKKWRKGCSSVVELQPVQPGTTKPNSTEAKIVIVNEPISILIPLEPSTDGQPEDAPKTGRRKGGDGRGHKYRGH